MSHGNAQIDKCFNSKSVYREYHVGQRLENNFVMCGGKDSSSFYPRDDCTVIGEHGTTSFQMILKGRVHASSVKLNHTTMWITGGRYYNVENTTEYVTANKATKGIDLPFAVEEHCMVKLEPNIFLLIGGRLNGIPAPSKKTWIINIINRLRKK